MQKIVKCLTSLTLGMLTFQIMAMDCSRYINEAEKFLGEKEAYSAYLKEYRGVLSDMKDKNASGFFWRLFSC